MPAEPRIPAKAMLTVVVALPTLLAMAATSTAGAQSLAVQFWEREYSTDDRKDLEDGVNLEECETNLPLTFKYTYSGSLAAGRLNVFIGAGCDQKTNRDEGNCWPAYEDESLSTSGYIQLLPAWIVEPEEDIPGCDPAEGSSDVYFMVLADDSSETAVVTPVKTSIGFDTEPPEPIEDLTASYGETLIHVSWDVVDPDYPEEWAGGFRLVCWGGSDVSETDAEEAVPESPDAGEPDASDGSSDPDALTDSPADVPEEDGPDAWDADAEADAAPDTGVDAVADTAADTAADPDAGEPAEGCPEGGFSEGDPYDQAYNCSGRLSSTTRDRNLTGLENNMPYKVAVIAIDDYGNESAVGTIVCETPKEVDDFWEVYKGDGGDDDGGFCFVATAAFGRYDHPAVIWLRAFRDEILAPAPGGDAVVAAYYEASPPAASWLRGHVAARSLARAALRPVAVVARVTVEAHRHPVPAIAVLLGIAMCLVALRAGGNGSGRKR